MPPLTVDRAFAILHRHVPRSRDGRENFLTDCFAAALADDLTFAREIVAMLSARDPVGSALLTTADVEVRTQVGEYPGCVLDLVLDVVPRSGSHSTRRLVVECKLGAPLGRDQLTNYLELPVWGIAVVAKKRLALPTNITEATGQSRGQHARWFAPSSGGHFFWSDVHALTERHATRPRPSSMVRALRGLLVALKLDPPHPEVGRFGFGGTPRERAQRAAFLPNWDATRLVLAEFGWPEPGIGKQAQLYTGTRDGARAGRRIEYVLLDPLADEGRILRIRLNAYSCRALDEALGDLRAARLPHNAATRRGIRTVPRAGGPARVLDVEVPMVHVLPVSATATARSRALATFVRAVLENAG